MVTSPGGGYASVGRRTAIPGDLRNRFFQDLFGSVTVPIGTGQNTARPHPPANPTEAFPMATVDHPAE